VTLPLVGRWERAHVLFTDCGKVLGQRCRNLTNLVLAILRNYGLFFGSSGKPSSEVLNLLTDSLP
jgi:hypothetical protein